MLALAFSAGATPQRAGRLTGITGKTYVITGASSGFGRGVALKLGAQGYGTLVNVGSVDSEVPLAYQATYSATKAGVLALDRALNEELRLNGLGRSIKVSTIMPWAADTPLWQHAANYTGGTPRMAAMDDPKKVVDAIVRASLHPKEAIPVGWKAQGSYVSHRIFPTLTERLSGALAQREQIQKAAPAPRTSGTLYRPMQSGQGVEGGARERMKQEDEQRREAGRN
jgi:short-subunit dehydrogenase